MTSSRLTYRKRIALAGFLGLCTVGALGASAASLGGLTAARLGADDEIVASCDADGITVGFTNAYDATVGRYRVTNVVLTGVAATCDTLTASVTLRDSTNANIGSGTQTVTASGTVNVPVTVTVNNNAEAVVGVAVVIAS